MPKTFQSGLDFYGSNNKTTARDSTKGLNRSHWCYSSPRLHYWQFCQISFYVRVCNSSLFLSRHHQDYKLSCSHVKELAATGTSYHMTPKQQGRRESLLATLSDQVLWTSIKQDEMLPTKPTMFRQQDNYDAKCHKPRISKQKVTLMWA